jgi:hypothetical protein
LQREPEYGVKMGMTKIIHTYNVAEKRYEVKGIEREVSTT